MRRAKVLQPPKMVKRNVFGGAARCALSVDSWKLGAHRKSSSSTELCYINAMWTRFLLCALSPVPVLYLLACGAITFAVTRGNVDRMINVMEFPSRQFSYPDVTGAYLSATVTPETVLFVGSSFTYGYSWAARFAFPTVFKEITKLPTVNAAVIGGILSDEMSYSICEMKRRKLHARAIVIELPIINEVGYLAQAKYPQRPIGCSNSGASPPSLFELIAKNPAGSLWWRHTGDIYEDYNYDYNDIQLSRVPDDYFTSRADFERIKGSLYKNIYDIVVAAKLYTDNVFAFVTPVYGPGVEFVGRDRLAVEEQIAFAEQACVALLAEKCIRTTQLTSRRELYSNMTHLSIRGNAIFARDIIMPALAALK